MTDVRAQAPAPTVDNHVHSQWSWDAQHGDMAATCARALEAGLQGVAFTEHADFFELDTDARAVVDLHAYLEDVARCRDRFPALRVRSGVELGQPHMHRAETSALLDGAAAGLDCVLGSVHLGMYGGRLVDISAVRDTVAPAAWPDLVRSSLALTLDLVSSDAPFLVLAHLDYAKRYWPHQVVRYDELDFEDEYCAVLEIAAARSLVLEVNSTRGAPVQRGLGPGLTVLRWWHQLGGAAVSFGSDSHDAVRVGRGLQDAAQLAAAAGFHPTGDSSGFWSRRSP